MASLNPPVVKRKRNLPGTPDPEAEVIALSPKTLMATNRFLCEICGKGFQRDQNLQLHRRGHNLPWKLRQRSTKDPRKRVYVCPEKSCVHHNPARALGDLTGIKKHFCRKHGEKKWKCDKCSKKYAVQADWKAHSKTCGTREYRCDCGTIFSRRDSFITHRAFCDTLAEETARVSAASGVNTPTINAGRNYNFTDELQMEQNFLMFKPSDCALTSSNIFQPALMSSPFSSMIQLDSQSQLSCCSTVSIPALFSNQQQRCQASPMADMSATALLQKAAKIGVTSANSLCLGGFVKNCQGTNQGVDDSSWCVGLFSSDQYDQHHAIDHGLVGETKDFLGVGVQTLCPTSISGWI